VFAPIARFALTSHRWNYANKRDETERQKIVREGLMLNPTLQYSTANGAMISDEALMEAITDHRPEALNEFYSRHGGRLKSVIGNVVHEEGDADDVLQDILLQIWHEADHYSPKAGKLLGWVVTLARRRAIDRLRRKQAYCRAKERYQEHLNEQSATVAPESHSFADDISRSDLRHFLHRRLNVLPRHQREALELAFFAGMSHREIAAITSAPLGTVKTRLELGLQKLTQSLRPIRHKI
jgi:RNA polymerase sigma-70 factor, ECF subfamily